LTSNSSTAKRASSSFGRQQLFGRRADPRRLTLAAKYLHRNVAVGPGNRVASFLTSIGIAIGYPIESAVGVTLLITVADIPKPPAVYHPLSICQKNTLPRCKRGPFEMLTCILGQFKL
jgi:hypothetical protein